MKIQLINPPMFVNPRALTALRPAPPLGLAYVAASLRRAGHDVSVIDAIGEAPRRYERSGGLARVGLSNDQVIARIDPRTQAIGVSSMWSFGWPVVREMLHEIRRAHPHVAIVCGGEHFTALPEHSMNEAPIDFIVMGEGEEIAVELFGRLDREPDFDRSTVRGICWRDDDARIVANPRAARTRAIDAIPWPAWDLVPIVAYDANRYVTGNRYGKTIPVLATRGCPYQCTFCSSPHMWTTRWYARDPVDLADEIEYYARRYGADHFPFQDLTSVIKRDWIVNFCNEMIRRDLGVRWQLAAGTRCEVIDDEVVSLLRRAGCAALYYAPESGSDKVRREIKKRLDGETLMKAAECAVRGGLSLGAFLVIGFPKDTGEDLKKTRRLAWELGRMGLTDVSCACFFPIPSTELYDYLVGTERIRLDDDFLSTPIHVHDKYIIERHNYCENVSAKKLTYYKYCIVVAFYASLWLHHPTRAARSLKNLFTSEETSKLDVFLNETKRRFLGSIGVRSKPPETIHDVNADPIAFAKEHGLDSARVAQRLGLAPREETAG